MKATSATPDGLMLSDPVVTYNDGTRWKVVPLKHMLSVGYLNDKMVQKDKIFNITLVVNPRSWETVVYGGKFRLDNDQLVDKNGNSVKDTTLRWEAQIMTFRNSLTKHRDPKYPIYHQQYDSYAIELPEPLVYGVIYHSSNQVNIKSMGVYGQGLDIVGNGVDQYLNKIEEQMRDKGSFIIPMLKSFWFKLYPDSKDIDVDVLHTESW